MTDLDDTTRSDVADADEQIVAQAKAGHEVLASSDADHVASLWHGIAAAAFDVDADAAADMHRAKSPGGDPGPDRDSDPGADSAGKGADETSPPHVAISGTPDPVDPNAATPAVADVATQDAASANVTSMADHRSRRAPHGASGWMAAAAAAIVIVVGGVWLVAQPTGQPVATFAMQPLDNRVAAQVDGDIVIDGDATVVEMDLSGLPALSNDQFYELWLLDLDAGQLVSLGEVDATTTTVAIDQPVDPTSFPVIDVSVEPADGPPDHSGDSVLRGPISAADSPG